ncbi:MAG: sigma-70 family RNA polymerase sigma factor [Planctomycetes bacterium]|nr:sigma-70 family RNA polymerase sigma factor [Planctomycetota bacterium]
MSSRTDVAEFLTQIDWVRKLARSLAGDAHLAEELAQDVWVAALESRPDTDRSARGWLATVLRRRWRDLRREHSRREAREHSASRPESVTAADELVERAAIQRRLVGAVLELDEPYRSTVLLRFFEGLPQREIARRMNTTTATVNSRLTRALERLRERLSRHGGATTWIQLLVPLLREPSVVPALAFGVAMKVFLASVAVVACLGGFAWWRSSTSEATTEPAPVVAAVEAEPVRLASEQALLPSNSDAARERAIVHESPPTSAPEVAATVEASPTLRGRVLAAEGVGLANVELALESSNDAASPNAQRRCTSGTDGWFEFESASGAEKIVCTDPRFETVLAGSAHVDANTTPTVVVAPKIRVAGVVVDEEHQPLAGVWVELRAPRGFGADFGLVLDFSIPRRWIARTAVDGRFELATAPALAHGNLDAALGGWAPHREPAPVVDALGLEIVLRRPDTASGMVRGVVLDPSGAPVEGAIVSADAQSSITDRDGEFAFDFRIDGTRSKLIALKRGFLPATFEPESRPGEAPQWPDRVVLQLDGEPGRASGRIVDHSGRPVAGARVWIDDCTYFGVVAEQRRVVEPLLVGDERFWSFVLSDADGAFELGGLLLDRDYRLRAIDPRSLAIAEQSSVRAGDRDLRLRLPTHELCELVAGRVVTRRGEPLAGVRVKLLRETFAIDHENGRDNETQESAAIITGDDGRFEFRNVSKTEVWVIASGDAILGEGLELSSASDPLKLEIVVSLRVHVQVELAEPFDRADSVGFLAEDGRPAYASVMRAGGSRMASGFALVDGRSEVLAIEERTTTLLLFLADVEVARIALHPTPGQLNVVRY